MASDGSSSSRPDLSLRDGDTEHGSEAAPAAVDPGEATLHDAVGEGGAPGGVTAQSPPSGGGRNWRRFTLEWLAVLLVAVGVAVAVRTFVVQTFYIPSASMEPTLMIGDRILVDKLSYRLHAVGRGDMVVFSRPPGEASAPEIKDLVKRVIGLPGDTISSPDGRVWINGKPLDEPWLPHGPAATTQGIRTQKIPPNEYFVMGDNRRNSQDSRYFGPIPRSLLVGRVFFRIWPLSHFGFL